MRNLLLSSLLALGLAGAVSAQTATPEPALDPTAQEAPISFGGPDPVRIETASGDTHVIMAELATTLEQKQRGMMWREAVAPGTGMLFQYAPPESAAMWMRNTLVDLDIIFIAPDGEIVKIIAFAQAESLRSLPAEALVAGVLELGAGQAIELGLRPGDSVHHAIFGNDSEPDMPADAGVAAEESPTEAQ